MALVTVQRSPSPSNTPETGSEDLLDGAPDSDSSLRSPLRSRRSNPAREQFRKAFHGVQFVHRIRSRRARKRFRKAFHGVRFIHRLRFSESYLAVKGAALILPQSECLRTVTKSPNGGDIQVHLQSMFYLLRQTDTIKVAVKLECTLTNCVRYMVVVSTIGRQDTEESVILGIDIMGENATIGLVLPIWGDMAIPLDGDGGFSIKSNNSHHNFKPVSVQAMWSALQSLIKARDNAHLHSYHPNGLTHTWVSWYRVNSEQVCINEWNRMEDLESVRMDVIDESSDEAHLQKVIKAKLKEIMMVVDLEEVTSKFLRIRLEEEMGIGLKSYRQFIDEEMIVILRQMDSASEIFEFLYLGSEWNASNLDELQTNGVGYILNITREIDNFFPGMFEYMNIRVFDVEQSDLLKYWENTFKFISKAREKNSKVLVHCKMGVSRSASTVIAFAMKEFGWSLDQALNHVKQKRSCVKPNTGFMQQLITYQGILDASKQRHNRLFRSKSTSNLEDLSMIPAEDGDDTHSLNHFEINTSTPAHAYRPRSWSPDDNTTQLLLKTQDLASENESSDEGDENEDLYQEQVPYFDMDYGPPLYPIENWEYSSRSADSLDDDIFLETSSHDSKGLDMNPNGPPVVLTSYRKFSQSSEEGDYPDNVTEESDLDDESAKETQVKVDRGFYDVCMLTADIEVPDCGVNPEERELNWDFAHPDVKIEAIMAQQRKHRRIAQLLKLSQSEHIKQEAGDIERPSSQKPEDSKVPLVPPNTPLCTKLKPDNFWIKEIPPSPLDPEKEGITSDVQEEEPPDGEVVPCLETLALTAPALTVSGMETSDDQPDHQVPTEDLQNKPLTQDNADSDGEIDPLATFPQQYEKEEIPWNPGVVKRQTQDFEEKIKSELTVSDERLRTASSSSTGSGAGSVGDSQEIVPDPIPEVNPTVEVDCKDEPCAFVTSDDPKTSALETNEGLDSEEAPPLSIYVTEEILLAPGLVQRTKEVIEQRERSQSLLESSPPKDNKPVQRSSSLKTERQASRKDRNSERRKTCLPVLRPSPPKEEKGTEDRAKSQEPADWLTRDWVESSSRLDGSTPCGDLVRQRRSKSDTSLKIYQVGTETLEVEVGKVQKHKKDFESKQDGSGMEQTPKESDSQLESPVLDNQAAEDSPPPESGDSLRIHYRSVKRQTQELEEKYGAVTPTTQVSSSNSQTNSTPSTNSDQENSSQLNPQALLLENKSPCVDSKQASVVSSHTKDSRIPEAKVDQSQKSELEISGAAEKIDSTVDRTMKDSLSTKEHATVSNEEINVNISTPTTGALAYSEDDITWSVGTVRQHKELIENKAKELATPLPPKKLEQGDPRYRMSPQTLKLIRDVGSLFVSSPTKSDGNNSPAGEGLVRQLARDIEEKSGQSVKRRLIIVEKDCGVNSQKKILLRSNSESIDRDIPANSVERSSSFKENVHSKRKSPHLGEQTPDAMQSNKSVLAISDIQGNSTKDSHKDSTQKCIHKTSSPKDLLIENLHSSEENHVNDSVSEAMSLGIDLIKGKENDLCDEAGEERIVVRDLVGMFEPRDSIKGADSSGDLEKIESPQDLLHRSTDGCKKSPSRDSKDRHSAGAKLMSTQLCKTASEDSKTEKPVQNISRTKHPSGRQTPEKKVTGGSTKTRTNVLSSQSRLSPEKQLPSLPVLRSKGTVSIRPRTATDPPDASIISEEPEEDAKGRRLSLSDLRTSPECRKLPSKSKSSFDIKTGGSAGLNHVPISPQREPDPSAPRRQRKQHGKTHPLSRLSGDPNSGKEPGRSRNPFYNTM